MIRTCILVVVACSLLAFVKASEADDNELQAELSKLGIGANPSDTIQAAAADAVNKAMAQHGAGARPGGAGGAQGRIPLPTARAQPQRHHSNDDWDDDEPDYLAIRKQKDFYPKKGDAMRLKESNFDEEIFNGEQEFTLVNFYSKWCKQCGYQAPSFRAAAKRYKNDPKVKIAVVNQEGNYDLSVRFDTEPSEPTIFYAHKDPQIDGDLKVYEGEVSFAALLQFIGSRGKEMMKVEKYVRPLFDPRDAVPRQDVNLTNFNETVFNKNKNVMMMFYAGWSEFCQVDASNYTVLAQRMAITNPDDVEIIAIDTDKHEHLADRFDVQGLPAYWFANKTAEKDTDLVKYTGDHNGAMVIEELEPYIFSQGQKVPWGMQHDWPIHPKPWEEIKAEMDKRKAEEKAKDDAEREEQEKRAVERREKLAAKKKKLQEKKDAKKKKKDEL